MNVIVGNMPVLDLINHDYGGKLRFRGLRNSIDLFCGLHSSCLVRTHGLLIFYL